jgi:hypothetical protein
MHTQKHGSLYLPDLNYEFRLGLRPKLPSEIGELFVDAILFGAVERQIAGRHVIYNVSVF